MPWGRSRSYATKGKYSNRRNRHTSFRRTAKTSGSGRTLAHPRPILILDDPFSALDKTTETEVFEHLRQIVPDSIIFLISHRLYLFSETDGVIWMDNGKAEFSSHEKLLEENSAYRELYQLQDRIPL